MAAPDIAVPAVAEDESKESLLEPTQALTFGFALLSIYILPIALFAITLFWTSGAQEPNWYFEWFESLSRNDASALTEIHQLLLPLLSGISVVAFRKHPRRMRLLIALALVGLFLTIGLDVALGVESLRTNLNGSNVDAAAVDSITALLRKARENLLLYLAIGIGIRVGGPS